MRGRKPELFKKAVRFAVAAHGADLDKVGLPVYRHPVRVAVALWKAGERDPVTLAAAALHDVIEDTKVTLEHVLEVFGAEVTAVVAALTRYPERETYFEYIAKVAKSPRAVKVKRADIADNLTRPSPPEMKLHKRSAKALRLLGEVA